MANDALKLATALDPRVQMFAPQDYSRFNNMPMSNNVVDRRLDANPMFSGAFSASNQIAPQGSTAPTVSPPPDENGQGPWGYSNQANKGGQFASSIDGAVQRQQFQTALDAMGAMGAAPMTDDAWNQMMAQLQQAAQ